MADDVVKALGSSPFDLREFRWRMGVRALDASEWLQVDGHRDVDLIEKERLLSDRFDEVAAFADASREAEAEILQMVVDALGTTGFVIRARGDSHPLVTAGRSVQEDLCLLEKREADWVLTGGVVCFPTKWSLVEKIGRPLGEIHAPVPGIDDISGRIDRFFDRMNEGSLVSRSNWSLTDTGSLRLEPSPSRAPVDLPTDPATDIWLRVERQTLRKLFSGDSICFTIRIHRWPLGEVVDQLPATALSTTLKGLPADIANYKDIAGFREELIVWLDRLGR